jgi:hypothetical protein
MKAPKIRAVDMVRQIRDRHAQMLTGKTTSEVIAFYRAAGENAMQTMRERAKPHHRKAG